MSTRVHEHDDASADDLRPTSKRPRLLAKACETCKLKKSKCDSSRPQCDACRRKGIACIYREKGRPGLRPGYGKNIECRLSVLENNLEKMNQSMQDVLSHVRSSGYAANTPLQTPISEGMATASAANNHHPNLEIAPLWETSQRVPDVASFTSSPMMARIPPPLGVPMTHTPESGLPSPDVLEELVEIFFNLVHPWFPLFHKPIFTANLFSPDRQMLLHAIVLISFRYWKKPEPSQEVRESYMKASRDQILLKTIDACTVVSTQSLALLALDAVGQGPGPRTWNVMSMLVATAKQLSLTKKFSSSATEANTPLVRNEEPDDDFDLSEIEAEEKRRLFWAVYSLDRFSSASHGQSGGIDSRTIKLPYPANDADWGQAASTEWFQSTLPTKTTHVHCSGNLWHHYIDLLAFMDRTNLLLVQPFNSFLPAHCQEWQSSFRRLDSTLSTWFESLPRETREQPATFNPMWTLVHATFHVINIRMYTVAAWPSTTSPYLPPSSSARGRCRRAVRDVASLTASLQPQELGQLGPIFAFVVWVAARSMVILWTTGYETSYGGMPKDLEILLSGLGQIATYWPCAQRYKDIIQLILDTKNTPGGPTGLDIFNDTRRTAYGLQNRLGKVPGYSIAEPYPHSFDFLDGTVLDAGDFTVPWGGTFGAEMCGDWL